MKKNITIVMLAIRAILIFLAVAVVIQFIGAYTTYVSVDEAQSSVASVFHLKPESVFNAFYIPYFHLIRGLLSIYLGYSLMQLYRSLDRLSAGEVFYEKQAADFRRAGAGIIIFAKCEYLVYMIFGVMCFGDIAAIFSAIPQFLGVYLGGKVVMVFADLAEQGKFLKEETELTI